MASQRDPVCGMEVDVTDGTPRSDYEGTVYYFCSEQCRQQFRADPARFAAAAARGGETFGAAQARQPRRKESLSGA